ncbi:MAG: DUF4097 family beta strand repeat-containing protein [Pseudomonadota bacterium]
MRIKWVAMAGLLVANVAVADRVLEEVSESYSLDKGASISLDNVNGDVRIEASGGREVRLEYAIRGDSEKTLERIKVKISDDPSHLRIETIHKKSGGWWGNNNGGSVSYYLRVPDDIELRGIDTVNGDIRIEGVGGEVNAETVNGTIEVSGLRSDAKLSTVNGTVEAYFDRFEADQRVSIESVNGRLEVMLPEDADVSVKAETVNGSLRNDFGLEVDKGFVGKDLRGSIGDGSARLTLDTVNGGISIRER